MDKKILGTGIALLAAGLLLTACGGTTDTSPQSTTTSAPVASAAHNDADVTFAQDMIGHHQQAIDMAKLASRASNAEVKDLAKRIEQAQGPEIQTMQGWLGQWGAGSMPGMDHGSMPGMMSDADLTELAHASGAAFDKMFLRMMIEHHQGAVDMAKAELTGGSNPDAKALAQRIISAQTAEISEMNKLLTEL